jgi:hypothetical protein
VVQGLFNRDTLCWFFLKSLYHEIFGLIGHRVLLGKAEVGELSRPLTSLNNSQDISLKRTDSEEKLVCKYPYFPAIDLLVIVLIPQLFGTEVARRTHERSSNLVAVYSTSEVPQLHVVLARIRFTSKVKIFSVLMSRWITEYLCM